MMYSRWTAIFSVGLLVCMTVSWWALQHDEQTAALILDQPPYQSETYVSYWRDRIGAVGAVAAYEEFADAIEQKRMQLPSFTVSSQHTAAHSFGDALYRQEGVTGVNVCDDRYSYGCFHMFFGRAVEEESLTVVPILNDYCMGIGGFRASNCQHGVGHGLLGFLGHNDIAMLNQALARCRDLPNTSVTGGCYSGVFMEYNLQQLLYDEMVPREVPVAGLGAPCTIGAILSDAQFACWYRLPQWWIQVLFTGERTKATYRALADTCATYASTDRERYACLKGLGSQIAIGADDAPEILIPMCAAITSDPVDHAWCIVGEILYLRRLDTAPSTNYCVDVAAAQQSLCTLMQTGSPSEITRFEEDYFFMTNN